MSEDKSVPDGAEAAPVARKKSQPAFYAGRKRKLMLLSAVFILAALVFLLLYFLVWRHEEHTDDAYVNGHLIQITPQIAGTVNKVQVDDTQWVKKNSVLVVLDDSDARLAFERAKNELADAIRQNEQQTAASRQAGAEVAAAQTQLKRLKADLARRESLAGTDAVSGEELEHARSAVREAEASLNSGRAREQAANAVIGGGVPVREQPQVLTAVSRVKEAWLNLQRTVIRAPADGQVARRNVQVGQKIAPGAPLMVVVPLNRLWVDANFKENQLADMRIGQPVKLTADTYGSGVVYHGRVAGLSAGTGSVFALLPAQNATGNWIKVVQRVPVRIALDPQELARYPLRVGLSVDVEVNTAGRKGKPVGSAAVPAEREEQPATDWAPVDALIEQIFTAHSRN